MSRQYQNELLSDAFGGGLMDTLRTLGDKFAGIVNGIDDDEWNPANDPFIRPFNYSIRKDNNDVDPTLVGDVLAAKKKVKGLLRSWSGKAGEPFKNLENDSVLIGVVSRIDYQKALILVDAIESICKLSGVQVAILGTAGIDDPFGNRLAEKLSDVARRYGKQLMFCNAFDIALSHILYAASDLFLVPSVFEPCGLTQLVAMAYGTVPIVRSVGGLVDTVKADGPDATGFAFHERDPPPGEDAGRADKRVYLEEAPDALTSAVADAVKVLTDPASRNRWEQLVVKGMSRDSSWEKPGLKYRELYYETIGHRLVTGE